MNDKNIVTDDAAASNAWTPEKLAELPHPRVRVLVHHKDGHVTVRCCYCGKKHLHSDHPIPGPRASHCQPGGQYVLLPKAKGGRKR